MQRYEKNTINPTIFVLLTFTLLLAFGSKPDIEYYWRTNIINH